MNARQVSVTRTIDAPADKIFELLVDPAKHPLIDGSGSVQASRISGSDRLALGATFGMNMRIGLPYRVTNTVVEFDEGRLIAWRHFFGHRWRWALTPIDEKTTEVTESFDWSTARAPFLLELGKMPGRNKQSIVKSLDRLQELMSG